MRKLLTVVSVAVIIGTPAIALATQIPKEEGDKVWICHRDNNVKQPYGPHKIEVSESAVDGEGNNDHTKHTGPVATSEAQAQALKDAKTKWGDIIPDKLNWTTEGQAIWNNDCQYVTPPEEEEPPVTPTPTPTPTPTSSTTTTVPAGSAVEVTPTASLK